MSRLSCYCPTSHLIVTFLWQ